MFGFYLNKFNLKKKLLKIYWSDIPSYIRYSYNGLLFKVKQFSYQDIFNDKSTLYFHCFYHYGDNIQNLVYLNAIAKKYPDLNIKYGVNPIQINQIEEFISYENLDVIPINSVTANSVDLWKNRFNYWSRNSLKYEYYDFYLLFYSNISKKIGFSPDIKNKKHLFTQIKKNEEHCGNYDILFVNSDPISSQFSYLESDLNDVIDKLSKKYRLITTKKYKSISSSSDNGLSLYQIGQLSLSCKCIIAISTGPSWPILNLENFKNKKPILLLGDSENVNFSAQSKMASSVDDILPFVNSVFNKDNYTSIKKVL